MRVEFSWGRRAVKAQEVCEYMGFCLYFGELWSACVVSEGEQSRNDEGGTDVVCLQLKVANPQLFHTGW